MDIDGVGVGGLGVSGLGIGGLGVDDVSVNGFRGEGGNGSLIGLGGDDGGGEGDAGEDVKELSKGVVTEFYYGERC